MLTKNIEGITQGRSSRCPRRIRPWLKATNKGAMNQMRKEAAPARTAKPVDTSNARFLPWHVWRVLALVVSICMACAGQAIGPSDERDSRKSEAILYMDGFPPNEALAVGLLCPSFSTRAWMLQSVQETYRNVCQTAQSQFCNGAGSRVLLRDTLAWFEKPPGFSRRRSHRWLLKENLPWKNLSY
jgi:hypothetical protein